MAVDFLVRTTDGPGGRRRGDILDAHEAPRPYGKSQTLPHYLVIRVSNVNFAQIANYLKRHEYNNPVNPEDGYRRSRYRVDLDQLPTNYAAEKPHLTITKQQIEPNMILRSFE